MPEIIGDSPGSACFSLHFESGNEENQSLGPDLLPFAAREQAGDDTRDDDTRDRAGRFAQGHSGNPRGRPRGIPNPKRRRVTLQAWRQNPEAMQGVVQAPALAVAAAARPIPAAGLSARSGRADWPPPVFDPHAGAGAARDTAGLVGIVARRDRDGRGGAHRAADRCPVARGAAARETRRINSERTHHEPRHDESRRHKRIGSKSHGLAALADL